MTEEQKQELSAPQQAQAAVYRVADAITTVGGKTVNIETVIIWK